MIFSRGAGVPPAFWVEVKLKDRRRDAGANKSLLQFRVLEY